MRTLMVVVMAMTGFLVSQADASKEDLKKLQGKWELWAINQDGKDVLKKDMSKFWTIKDNKLIYASGAYDLLELDATKSPRTMDLQTVREKDKDLDGKKLKGIYKIDGDTAVLCVDPSGKVYPPAFESKEGTGFRLFTIRRVKE